jgi:hypothetical protein
MFSPSLVNICEQCSLHKMNIVISIIPLNFHLNILIQYQSYPMKSCCEDDCGNENPIIALNVSFLENSHQAWIFHSPTAV